MRPAPNVDLREPFSFTFDHDDAFAVYKRALEGAASEDELSRWHRMFAVRLILRSYCGLPDEILEALVQNAVITLWKLARRRKLPSDRPQGYRAYCDMVVRRACAYWLRERARLEKAFANSCGRYDSGGLIARCSTTWDVEASVLVDELPRSLASRIARDLRLFAFPKLEAVYFVVARVVAGRPISEAWLSQRFRVASPAFFIAHIRLRMRMALLRVRSETKPAYRSEVYSLMHAVEELWASQGRDGRHSA